MADYPDWTRLFYLTGTAITIPISIETSTVTLDVNLAASAVQLDVNIAAAAVTLDINFLDQSVAVFDANQWFALQALQWTSGGVTTLVNNTLTVLVNRTVPAGKTSFVTGFSCAVQAPAGPPLSMTVVLSIAGSMVAGHGGGQGAGLTFDTPLRATAGQVVSLSVGMYGAGGNLQGYGFVWGYDRTN